MSISILIEPTATGFHAETGSPLNLSVDAASSELAVSALRAKIVQRLQNGTQIIQLPVPTASVRTATYGRIAEHPLFDEWLEAVKTSRAQREAEEEAAEQRGE